MNSACQLAFMDALDYITQVGNETISRKQTKLESIKNPTIQFLSHRYSLLLKRVEGMKGRSSFDRTFVGFQMQGLIKFASLPWLNLIVLLVGICVTSRTTLPCTRAMADLHLSTCLLWENHTAQNSWAVHSRPSQRKCLMSQNNLKATSTVTMNIELGPSPCLFTFLMVALPKTFLLFLQNPSWQRPCRGLRTEMDSWHSEEIYFWGILLCFSLNSSQTSSRQLLGVPSGVQVPQRLLSGLICQLGNCSGGLMCSSSILQGLCVFRRTV